MDIYDSCEPIKTSFPDAEPAEDLIQNVLDVDPASDAAKRRRSTPQIFSAQFGMRRIAGQKGFKIFDTLPDRLPVPQLG